MRVSFVRAEREAQRVDADRIELRARHALQLRERLVHRSRAAVRTVGRHRLERVGDEDDARLGRDLLAAEAVGIAAPVEVLVVMAHPTCFLLELGRRHDRVTDSHVAAHLSDLVGAQPPGLPEDPVGDADLADVVQQAGEPEPLDPVGVEAERLPDQDAQLGDGLAVVSCSHVLRVDGPRERRGEEPVLPARRPFVGMRGRLRRQPVGVEDDLTARPLCVVQREVRATKQRVGGLECDRLGNPASHCRPGGMPPRFLL